MVAARGEPAFLPPAFRECPHQTGNSSTSAVGFDPNPYQTADRARLGDLTWSLVKPPAGVTISRSTGVVAVAMGATVSHIVKVVAAGPGGSAALSVSMYISAAVSVTYVVVGAGGGGRVATGTAVIAPGRLWQYDIAVGTRDGTADSSLSGPGVAVTALGSTVDADSTVDARADVTSPAAAYGGGGDGAGVVVVSIPTVAFHRSCLAGSFTSAVVGPDTVVTFTGAGTLQMIPADDSAHACRPPPLGADTMCAALLCTAAFFV